MQIPAGFSGAGGVGVARWETDLASVSPCRGEDWHEQVEIRLVWFTIVVWTMAIPSWTRLVLVTWMYPWLEFLYSSWLKLCDGVEI